MMIIDPNLSATIRSAQQNQKVSEAMEAEGKLLLGHSAREALARLSMKSGPRDKAELVMIRGSDLGSAPRRTTQAIHREGIRRRLLKPSPDAALLLKETLPMEVLEYRQIVFMHKPIRDFEQHPSLFCWERKGAGDRHALLLLEAYPATLWSREAVFIFEASPVETAHPVRQVRRVAHPWMREARSRPCWAI